MDTVFALASALGKAGVSVIRISGARAHDAGKALAGDLPPARKAAVRQIRGQAGDVIDEALVLAFDAGASFTGESVVEIQTHGSPAIVAAVLGHLGAVPGLRSAEPGEFTRRALENGRLDLAQVEGLADLIESETDAQRRMAMRVFSGALGDACGRWRRVLIRCAALLDVSIDFVDEDVPDDVRDEVCGMLRGLVDELRIQIAGVGTAERVRDGFEVALVGATNVGKSTLLNRLAGREAAITSEVAGTTRDIIEVRMDLFGLPVTILDTAGLREGGDAIEEIGQARTRARAGEADLRVVLLAAKDEAPAIELREDDVVLVGKSDQCDGGDISGLTGEGVDLLLQRIARSLEERVAGVGVAVRHRHMAAMESAVVEIAQARAELGLGPGREEIAAEHLRRGMHALDSLVGKVDVEDVLDDIFSSFCLGK